MRRIWQVLAVVALGLSVGLAVVGCSSSTESSTGKMGSDKMGKMSDKMGDKMGSDKMGKMGSDKMGDK
jgi:hypothetical protein